MEYRRYSIEMGLQVEPGGTGDETRDRLDVCADCDGEDVCCGLEDFAKEESCFSGLGVRGGGFDYGG